MGEGLCFIFHSAMPRPFYIEMRNAVRLLKWKKGDEALGKITDNFCFSALKILSKETEKCDFGSEIR